MFPLLIGAALAADPSPAASPVGTPAASPAVCAARMNEGTRAYDRGASEAAAAAWGRGYADCGPGSGFLAYQGTAMARMEQYDAAAALVLRELAEPGATPLALKLLIALNPKVSEAVHAEVRARGRSPDAAIVIPDLQGEYAWIRFLICGGPEQALRRVLTSEAAATRDHVEFVCSDGVPQTLYFVPPPAASPAASPPPAAASGR